MSQRAREESKGVGEIGRGREGGRALVVVVVESDEDRSLPAGHRYVPVQYGGTMLQNQGPHHSILLSRAPNQSPFRGAQVSMRMLP